MITFNKLSMSCNWLGMSDKELKISAEFCNCCRLCSLIFNIPNVILNKIIDPSRKKQSHIRNNTLVCTTEANNVRNLLKY